MLYLSFVGNHDDLENTKNGLGAVRTIFLRYKDDIERVFLLISPSTKNSSANYDKIAQQCKAFMVGEKPGLAVDLVTVDLKNPVDFDLVYPKLLLSVQEILNQGNNREKKKVINITSGTPTMMACWVLLHKSGLIPNSVIVQSFESKFARDRGQSTQEVNLDIQDFPEIKAPEELRLQLDVAHREKERLQRQVDAASLDDAVPELIGHSEEIRKVKETILNYVDNETHVLIYGERGTGKEQVARAIWRIHHRPGDDELKTYNCSGFSDELIVSGLFGYRKGAFTGADRDSDGIVRQCDGRMLFLDEIGNFPLRGQHALLRLLQFGDVQPVGAEGVDQVNVQIIAASNKDIHDPDVFAQDVKDRFVEKIPLPPLRSRREDIPLLANHFLHAFSQPRYLKAPFLLSQEVMDKLQEHSWRGNVRDLQTWIQRLVRRFDGGTITLEALKKKGLDHFAPQSDEIELPDLPLPTGLSHYVELIREKAYHESGGNMARMDRLLGQKEGTEKQRKYRKKKAAS